MTPAATIALGLLLALLLVALATWGHLVYWTRRLRNSDVLPYDELESLPTPDGGRIELRRLHAQGEPVGPPLLLVHGLAFNHRNFDIHPDWSLPRWFAARGRDVWLLTLRSGQPSPSFEAPISFAAMVDHDLPTAVDAVLARAGATHLDYIGFSMGGMLLYAALGRSVPTDRVRKAVIMGSPAKIGIPVWPFSLTPWVPRWFVPRLYLRQGARLIAFGSEWFKTPFHRIPFNPDNVDRGVVGGMLVDGVQDVPRALNQDFVGWALADGELRVRGERALDGLVHISVPVLFCAGQADQLAPPRSVRYAFDSWGSGVTGVTVDKRWLLLARSAGAGHDYGHGDMLMARRAVQDVFEPISVFIGVRTLLTEG